MEKVVRISKETYELGEGISKFIAVCVKATKDGWQYGDDLPSIISSAVSDLLPSLDGVQSIASEFSNDQEAFYATVSLIGIEILKAAGAIKSGRPSSK